MDTNKTERRSCIEFLPKLGERVEFCSDRQFGKGPFSGSVLRMDNGIAEIGHSDGQDWGFVITDNMKVKAKKEFHDGRICWTLF